MLDIIQPAQSPQTQPAETFLLLPTADATDV